MLTTANLTGHFATSDYGTKNVQLATYLNSQHLLLGSKTYKIEPQISPKCHPLQPSKLRRSNNDCSQGLNLPLTSHYSPSKVAVQKRQLSGFASDDSSVLMPLSKTRRATVGKIPENRSAEAVVSHIEPSILNVDHAQSIMPVPSRPHN